MVSTNDVADRPARALADGEELSLGKRVVRWFDTPHVPHGWDCGLMIETTTRTFLCGDLFTQGGTGETPLTETDILGPSEAFRAPMDYFAHAPDTGAILERLAAERPTNVAHSTNGWQRRQARSRCAGGSRRWSPPMTWRIDRPAHWPTVKC